MSDDLEKFRTVRLGGKTKGKTRIRHLEGEGEARGFEIEYGDGRIEAIVRPATVRTKFSISRREVEQ